MKFQHFLVKLWSQTLTNLRLCNADIYKMTLNANIAGQVHDAFCPYTYLLSKKFSYRCYCIIQVVDLELWSKDVKWYKTINKMFVVLMQIPQMQDTID